MRGQITLKVNRVPSETKIRDTLFVAGNFNNWDPAASPLFRDEKGNYAVVIPEGTGILEYKFTRGSWESAESNVSHQKLPNRTINFNGKPQTVYHKILGWEKNYKIAQGTAAANVHILDAAFPLAILDRTRKIWVYLPPDYKTGSKKYPVIYMQDGQNLFDNATSFSGEWGIDETLNQLFEDGDPGAIVIGIENGGENRIAEYTPWNNPKYGGGEGELYLKFIAETLKPYVDLNFRTKPEKEFTALMGSSLGALISTYGVVKYSGLFSKVGSFSPAYWIVRESLDHYLENSSGDLSATKVYTVAGSKESETMNTDIMKVEKRLQKLGLSQKNSLIKLDEYGAHNEQYWKGEFRAAYLWLFKSDDTENSKN